MVPELIARLDRWLAANRPEYYARLQPGVTDAQLDAFEDRFRVRLPVAFRLLFKWRNGQDDGCYDPLETYWMFSSLESVAGTKEMCDGMIGWDFDTPEWWRREWVPFLADYGGDHKVVDLLGIAGGRPGQVVTFIHDDSDRPVEFPSLEAWLTDLVEAMEGGTLEVV
jgi:cell wall assembly regulator SMI1